MPRIFSAKEVISCSVRTVSAAQTDSASAVRTGFASADSDYSD